MAATGESGSEAPPPVASSEATPSTESNHSKTQQFTLATQVPAPAEDWSGAQFLGPSHPNGTPAGVSLQARSPATLVSPFASEVTCPPDMQGATNERRFQNQPSERPIVKTESDLHYQQSGSAFVYTEPVGSTASETQASTSTRGKKRLGYPSDFDPLDDGDDDEDADLITRYDPKSEILPKTQVHHPSFRRAEEHHNGIYEKFLDILEAREEEDSDLDFVRSKARSNSGIDYPSEIIIALKGSSGVGKSSLLNAILGLDDAIETGDGSKACTAVVQELRYRDSEGEMSFHAEIDFIPESSREKAIAEYLDNFFDHHKNEIDPNDPEYHDLLQPYSTCIEALSSMFCNQEGFDNQDGIEEYLKSFNDATIATLKQKLMSWLNATMKSLNVQSDSVEISASSDTELSEAIRPFLTFSDANWEDGERKPSLWPVVKVVRLFCDSEVLKQGIILVDLPGTGDTNRTRMAATMEYMRKVDCSTVVSCIERSETNEALNSDVLAAYKRSRQGSAVVVLTKSDGYKLDPYSSRNPSGVSGGNDVCEIHRLRLEVRKAKDHLASLKRRATKARQGDDLDEERRINAEREQWELEEVNRKNRFFDYCVCARNAGIISSLARKYKKLTSGRAPLAVFCVSNSLYNQHVEGIECGQDVKMKVETTGIPALRAHFYSLPAAKKFKALEHQCGTRLDYFLNMVELVCNVTKLKRKEDMEQIILSSKNTLFEDISKAFDKFKDLAIIPVLEKIKSSRHKWIASAKSSLEEWSKWKAGKARVAIGHIRSRDTKFAQVTFRATCRRSGRCANKTLNKVDWNTVLLKPVVRDLEKDMEQFDNPGAILAPILQGLFDSMVDSIHQRLEREAVTSRDALEPFFRILKGVKDEFQTMSVKASDELGADLSAVKMNMLTAVDLHSSYLVSNLDSTYKECFDMEGKNMHQARVRALQVQVNDVKQGPYMAINSRAREATSDLLKWHANQLTNRAIESLNGIRRIFSMSFGTEGGNTPTAREIRLRLRNEVDAARAIAEGPLRQCLDECRSFGK